MDVYVEREQFVLGVILDVSVSRVVKVTEIWLIIHKFSISYE